MRRPTTCPPPGDGLSKQVHPDLARDEADRLRREHLSRVVNDMCDTLLDPLRRFDYDRRLARARRWDGGPGSGPQGTSQPASRPADPWRPSAAWTPSGQAPSTADADQDFGPNGPWLDESEWFADVPSGVHPIVSRYPVLAPLEPWLTWSVAMLALLMLGVATVIYMTVGDQMLAGVGLHFGRFGSLAVVVGMAAVLVVGWLALMHLWRSVRRRLRHDD